MYEPPLRARRYGWGVPGAGLRALLLPALALAIPQSAVLTRGTRASVVEVMNEDFVRTARAKGASVSRALWRHAVPNALVPVITMLGLQISFLIGGAVLVENVFTLPGMGRLAWQARVRGLAAQLDAMSPLAVLGRGYAVCWNESRTSIIRSAQAVEPGEAVRVTLAEGELTCRVQATTDDPT